MSGVNDEGEVTAINLTIKGVKAANPAFDITPAKYVTGLITEHGIVAASTEGLQALQTKAVG